MTSSIISKKIIANSLKYLMETESFHKISVSDIMLHCQMRRQTFYYHFKDKFELLSWIYKEETKENIIDFLDYETWENIFDLLFDYFYENQKFYRNAFKVIEQNSFNHYLFEHTKNLYMKIIDELSMSCRFSLSDETKNTIASFYSHGFVGTIKDWIESKCEVDPSIMSSLMKNMINNQLLLLLEQSAK
ncbi:MULTISPECIES: dihydroxyacetone kinase transcriptional activator DhaS [Bacillus cereus group]|uniref:dihydroxyacetone kinase transcriptional activator DhaS n=1 Tax=Bacillus cereus group TaxID=86661 RepID=UPI000330018E|nr:MULTISPECIES: dihydroxyacetone kinase transcriptional activator DhaS [Bacillus cereus group]EOO14867.1 TetR family transcriptional regulator [Bacillus cereus HuA2-9]MCZ6939081.1 dihydroxyacetone kinase transcriptional activator DhaS [Bacillus mycoides]